MQWSLIRNLKQTQLLENKLKRNLRKNTERKLKIQWHIQSHYSEMDKDHADCPWCGSVYTQLLFINGHYSCNRCKQVIIPCCNGETSESEIHKSQA